ncbi:MAG: hypothetical protein WCI55_11410 [Armatimonadota bacterium]
MNATSGNQGRQLIVVAITSCVVAIYAISLLQKDSLSKASNRFGNAVISSDVATLWSFVPDDERHFYGLDESKFAAYWKEIVQPKIKGVDSYELAASASNGITVIAKSSHQGRYAKSFGMLVSGQRGHYFVPYIVATSSIHSASSELGPGKIKKSDRFQHYAKWIVENHSKLSALGISNMRRGPMYQNESLDEIKQKFLNTASEELAREKARSAL